MDEQFTQILLQEFRSFRDQEFRAFRGDLSEWQQQTGERVASLESDVKQGIRGNGQPSRLAEVEEKVAMLEKWKWYLMGAWVVVAAAISTVTSWLLK